MPATRGARLDTAVETPAATAGAGLGAFGSFGTAAAGSAAMGGSCLVGTPAAGAGEHSGAFTFGAHPFPIPFSCGGVPPAPAPSGTPPASTSSWPSSRNSASTLSMPIDPYDPAWGHPPPTGPAGSIPRGSSGARVSFGPDGTLPSTPFCVTEVAHSAPSPSCTAPAAAPAPAPAPTSASPAVGAPGMADHDARVNAMEYMSRATHDMVLQQVVLMEKL